MFTYPTNQRGTPQMKLINVTLPYEHRLMNSSGALGSSISSLHRISNAVRLGSMALIASLLDVNSVYTDKKEKINATIHVKK